MIPVPSFRAKPIVLLLFVVSVLILNSCGGGSQGETTSGSTSGTESTSTEGSREVTGPAELANAVVELTPSRNSGVSGIATFTGTDSGVEVQLVMEGLADQPGTEHLAHIHQGGTCANDRMGNGARVLYPLNSVSTTQDGANASTTVIPGVTVAELFAGPPKYINVHAEQTAEETPPGIACADLSQVGGESTGVAVGGEPTAIGSNTQ